MTSIEGGMSLIEREEISPLTKRVIEVNRVAMGRARKVISQLMAFSRRQVLRPKATNIGETMKVFEPLLQRAVGEAVKLEWSLDADAQVAYVDPGQLQSALLNLVINARDAMPQGGTLRIFTENLVVPVGKQGASRQLLPGEYVVVGVQDNGSGMSEEVLRRASEPFFTTKGLDKGSGLGLSQCDGFASQSGGALRIESRLGEGTIVRMILPRRIAAHVTPQPGHSRTILGSGLID